MHENGLDCLSSENKEILQNAEQLRTEFKKRPCHLERLHGHWPFQCLIIIVYCYGSVCSAIFCFINLSIINLSILHDYGIS